MTAASALPGQIDIDQRRGARPLPDCPNCGGRLVMGRFTHPDPRTVVIIADCGCGQRARIIRSAPRRLEL